mmetsp:Transcript_1595/g.1666  ORF Transcript_1595/g.1666 Transcript_1595/m.1666 type:complete len:81 (+) Transcript_1595:205-447(+)
MTGSRTVPNIWVNGTFVGGCNDGPENWMGIKKLINNGDIKKLLNNASSMPDCVDSSKKETFDSSDKDKNCLARLLKILFP